jgi:hypothetical protein
MDQGEAQKSGSYFAIERYTGFLPVALQESAEGASGWIAMNPVMPESE